MTKHTRKNTTKKITVNPKTTAKETKPKRTPEEEAEHHRLIEEMMMQQLTDRKFAPVEPEEYTKSITYVTARNGLFKVTKTHVALFKVMLEEFDSPVIGLTEMEEGVELLIPKLDFRVLIEALSWYRDINNQDGTEASILYFWNHNDVALPDIPGLSTEGKLVIYCPVQENSPARSTFKDDQHVHWMRENLGLLLETHSHRLNSFKRSA